MSTLAPLQSILNMAGGDAALVTGGGEGSQGSGLYSSSPLVLPLHSHDSCFVLASHQLSISLSSVVWRTVLPCS